MSLEIQYFKSYPFFLVLEYTEPHNSIYKIRTDTIKASTIKDLEFINVVGVI